MVRHRLRYIAPASMIAVSLSVAAVKPDNGDNFMHARHSVYDSEQPLSLREMFGPPTSSDYIVINGDTLRFDFASHTRGLPLTEEDYRQVAAELDVEVAAIKAIVDVETGRIHRGFNPDNSPVIYFDLKVFRTMAARRKINLANYTKSHSDVFERPNAKRFGSQQLAHHECLRRAMSIDTIAAIEGTFWGMFQIGGFNWKRCGAESPEDFAELMSRTERDQLNLFAGFMRSSGLLPHLRDKNWAAFAKGYNGPAYASQGYHTKMAAAYKRHSAKN